MRKEEAAIRGEPPSSGPPRSTERCPSPPRCRLSALLGSFHRRCQSPLALPRFPLPPAAGCTPAAPALAALSARWRPALALAGTRWRRRPSPWRPPCCGGLAGLPWDCLHGGARAAPASARHPEEQRDAGDAVPAPAVPPGFHPLRRRCAARGGSLPGHIPEGSAAAPPFAAILGRSRGGELGRGSAG